MADSKKYWEYEKGKTSDIIQEFGRIKYVEPNDVFGYGKDINGNKVAPLTPDYEDLCIAFNLIIETYDRLDNQKRNEIGLMWTDKLYTEKNGEQKVPYVSVVDGGLSDSNGNRFLSTYYTEISADGYVKKEMVEGLGVESIQVAFDSYYTPTVNIKFIDVRGSALFGREEAIHTDSTGTGSINGKNIFGAFMTQPYPKFRLQMKGFYGKDVTYQLTVSNFTANFNAKTGNVEANVSFVGYTWSLLTDIPFIYLIAAPYCNYEGKKYWNAHVNDPEWAMINSNVIEGLAPRTIPPRLAELFLVIKDAYKQANENNVGSNIEETSAKEKSNLTILNEKLAQYNEAKKNNSDEIGNLYDEIQTAVENCSRTFTIPGTSTTDGGTTKTLESVTSKSYFWENTVPIMLWDNYIFEIVSYYENMNKNRMLTLLSGQMGTLEYTNAMNQRHYDIPKLKQALQDQYKFSQDIVSDYQSINSFTTYNTWSTLTYDMLYDKILNYEAKYSETKNSDITVYPDLTNLKSEVEDALATVVDDVKEEIEKSNKEFVINTIKGLNIDPNIYNIFKILMCHLETFVHILFKAGQEIKEQEMAGLRSPSVLGVKNFSATDLPDRMSNNKDVYLPAWTAVTNENGNNVNDINQIEYTNSYKWVGSLTGSNRWVEERVVWSLQNAIQQIRQNEDNHDTKNNGNIRTEDVIPVLPSDVLSGMNCFSNLRDVSFDSICGNLGFRITQLFGIMDEETDINIINKIGELDAYNYYLAMHSVDDIKTNIIENTSKGSASELMEGIMAASSDYVNNYGTKQNNNGEVSYVFEYEPVVNGNQPIFTVDTNNYEYLYMKDKNNNCIIPNDFFDFNKKTYQEFADYAGNGVFEGKIVEEDNVKIIPNWLCSNDTQLNGVVNNNMFSLITDKSDVEYIEQWYKKLKMDNLQIKKYSVDKNYEDFVNRYWKVSYEDYKERINNTYPYYFFGKKVNNRNLTSTRLNSVDELYEVMLGDNKDTRPSFTLSSEYGILNVGGETCSVKDIYLTQLGIKDTRDVEKIYCSLFGHPFYYDQNRNLDGLSAQEAKLRTLESKAFLFLQSLPRTNKNLNYEFTSHGGYAMWNKVNLLYLGGLLYRQEYYKKSGNKYDLIQYENKYKFNDFLKNGILTLGDEKGLCILANQSGFSANSSQFQSVDDYIGFTINDNIKQQLINEFKKFARDAEGFVKFIDLCELKGVNKNVINGDDLLNLINDTSYDIIKDNNVYDAFRINTSGTAIQLVFKQDSTVSFINEFIKEVCFGKAIVCFNSKAPNVRNNGNVVISKNKIDSYLNSFVETLNKIYEGSTTNETEYNSTGLTDNIDVDESVLLAIYLYCKNLWEKWLLPKSGSASETTEMSETYYDVKRFYKNFVFIDTYYNDISTKLKINLDIFYQKYIGRSKDGSLFSFIGDIVGEHRSLFVGLPDYVDLGLGIDGDVKKQRQAIDNMEKMFRPLPHSKMGSPRNDNHFVVIYTYPPASKMPEEFSYRYDGWDIWSVANDENMSGLFKCVNKDVDEDGVTTKFGYNIPAFGVSFGRQNNHLFKDFQITMNNPVQTEQSLKALQNVAELANGNSRKICFYGQDIYNIYSNYSYQIEVEMMGNAQIQPLMYFQLSNIPMWRGMYMIFNVSHTMTAGNMITRFKGMKMTRYPVPILSKYWSFLPENDILGVSYNGGSWDGSYVDLPGNYKRVDNPSKDWFSMKENDKNSAYSTVSDNAENSNSDIQSTYAKSKDLFNRLYEEIMLLDENQPKMKWNIGWISQYRKGDGNSCHASAAALDLVVQFYDDNGKVKSYIPGFNTSKDASKLFTVLDIIISLHSSEMYQITAEYMGTEYVTSDDGKGISMLHVSVKHPHYENSAGDNPSDHNKGGDISIWTKKPGSRWYTANSVTKDMVPPAWKAIAKKVYYSGNTALFKRFKNGIGSMSDEQAQKYFGANTTDRTVANVSVPAAMEDRIKKLFNILKNLGCNTNATIGIVANACRETSCGVNTGVTTDAAKKSSTNTGIWQWNSGGALPKAIEIAESKGWTVTDNNMFSLTWEQQSEVLIEQLKTYKCDGSGTGRDKTKTQYEQIQNASDGYDAADIFMCQFERPADKTSCRSKNNGYVEKIIEMGLK